MSRIKVAVTGAAGQVGSVLVKRMLDIPEIETVAICRNSVSAGMINFSAPGCDIRVGSITEKNSAQKLLGDADVIVNCALAMVSGRPKESRNLNKAMIECFSRLKGLKTLIHLSSISVYGGAVISEKSSKNSFENPCPDNDYGRSKLFIERSVKRMCAARKLNYYILRLGHVIGANMDRSRQVIEYAKHPLFRLPFNGDIPSNTVHVERLAAMIIKILVNPVPSGTYNVADKNRTWRDVLNWHTQTIGLPPVKGMSEERSNQLRTLYLSRSIVRDIIDWAGSIPALSIVTYPSVFEFAYRLLTILPTSFTNRAAVAYKRKDTSRQIAAILQDKNHLMNPAYYSDPMPGRYLAPLSSDEILAPPDDALSNQLKAWCYKFSNPTWLLESENR